jgi:hypothetical protein
LKFDDFCGKFDAGVFAMCTVTLELSDELVAAAEKQGLLSPPALEAYIRQKLRGLGKKPPLAQTMENLWELCKDVPITVDSFLEERHAETEREEAE